MGSDRARVSFDPSRHWRRVIAQQGRVSLEADLNEASDIEADIGRLTALDVVGPFGTPDGGFGVTAVPRTDGPAGSTPGDLTIGAGTLYLGGERLSLDNAVTYSAQPDWLDHSGDPLYSAPAVPADTGNELVYLLATEQEVSAVEDPALADVALGGPDTAQRLRILQRVARTPTGSAVCSDAWTQLGAAWEAQGCAFDPATMELASTTRLLVTFPSEPAAPTPCQPVATGGYVGAENQLYRVVVTDVANGVPTIVWGPDDASFLYRVTAATYDATTTTTTVTLASKPVDSFHWPQKGQVVELLRDAAELTSTDYIASAAGYVTPLSANYDADRNTLALQGEPPPGYLDASTPQLYVRVWQGMETAPSGVATPLGDTGVAVTLTSPGGVFHAGDFWRFALRPIKPSLVYPARYLESAQPPDGPRTWAGPLAVVAWAGGVPAVTACVPGFDSLVGSRQGSGGCCTVEISPSDVGGGAGLPAFVARYAGKGPTTICFAEGTYTLAAPLVLGPEHDGLRLRGCETGVVLAGPTQPGPPLTLGLIAIEGASDVTMSGFTIEVPAVPFTAAPGTFAGVADQNQALMEAYASQLDVAIGVSIDGATNLSVDNCSFAFPELGGRSRFAAGIYATATVEGLSVTGCSFGQPDAPATVAFGDLTRGTASEPPYDLTCGIVQVPTPAPAPGATPTPRSNVAARPIARDRSAHLAGVNPAGTVAGGVAGTVAGGVVRAPATDPTSPGIAIPVLHDAAVESCLFDGLSVPVLILGHVGTCRLDRNSIRNCYAGVWIASFDDTAAATVLNRLAVGNPALWAELVKMGISAMLDRILAMTLAMGQVLPTRPPAAASTPNPPVGGLTFAPSAAELQRAQQLFAGFVARSAPHPALATARAAAAPATGLRARFQRRGTAPTATPVATTVDLSTTVAAAFAGGDLGTIVNAVAPAETGTDIILRLELADSQIDAVVAGSSSGTAVAVIDFSSVPGSLLLHDNRIRSRNPQGQSVLVYHVYETTITGNLVANEIVTRTGAAPYVAAEATAHSLVLRTRDHLAVPAVAVTGNVLVSPAILPRRPEYANSAVPATLQVWDFLNTVTGYVDPPAPASVHVAPGG